MSNGRGCRKIGNTAVIMNRHPGSHVLDFLELWNPEIFVNVQIAGIRLRCIGIGAEKIQGGTGRQLDMLALELHP